MEKQSPLDIPEILILVTSFVPVWDKSRYFKFSPQHLSCALVSKLWRQASLPHLWAVYTTEMENVPVDVIFRNSHHIRNILPDSGNFFRKEHPGLWQKDASAQLLLRCTALKSFSLMLTCLHQQVELIRLNSGIISLNMPFTSSMISKPLITKELVACLGKSLKILRLSEVHIMAPELVSFLNNFLGLERLQMGINRKSLNIHSLDTLNGSTGVRIQTLRQLTIFDRIGAVSWGDIESVLSIFQNCPIEHVVLNIIRTSMRYQTSFGYFEPYLQHLRSIRETVLTWRSQLEQGASHLLTVGNTSIAADTNMGISAVPLSQSTNTGLQRLDIHIPQLLDVQFRNGCQDLVTLMAIMDRAAPLVIVPLVESFKNMLRDVDLTCERSLDGYNAFKILNQLVGSLSELRRLTFVAEYELNKEYSVATFRGDYFQDDQDGGSMSSSTIHKTTRTEGWACQHLESLTIRGLWGATSEDRPNDGQDTVTLKAASNEHHWVACGTTYFDEQLRTAISDRIQILPELRQLTLGRVAFEYSKILL
ncbi:hypothetical protein BG005_003188 [Podila minutissima]|nr:hypothetical protein BG005_003188 [Podila minutissima]